MDKLYILEFLYNICSSTELGAITKMKLNEVLAKENKEKENIMRNALKSYFAQLLNTSNNIYVRGDREELMRKLELTNSLINELEQ